MKIVGLIAEYNPFHNGHQYHIEKAKEMTGAEAVIVVMSGNFVQRGMPAVMPKHLRTEMALMCGADLIVELPMCYATGTAEQFAYGAVSLLDKLGCVDAICFGSECGNLPALKELSDLLTNEPMEYQELLRELVQCGMSFPAARQQALQNLYPDKDYESILREPNNILGIEYLKALSRLNSRMIPHTLKRLHSHYHDIELQEEYSSASAIREAIERDALVSVREQLPPASYTVLQGQYEKCFPIYTNDLSLLLKYCLLNETKDTLMQYADMSEDLAYRVYNHINKFTDIDQFCQLLKTKEMTYSRISRALLHSLLRVYKSDYTPIEYAHILGFRKDKTNLLSECKKTSSIPLITKLSADHTLSENGKKMLDADIYASNLYYSIITEKYKTSFVNEYEHPIVLV